MKRSIALAALLAVAPFASAQFFGPGAQGSANNVKAVLDDPVDDQYVVLRGNLTSQVGSEKYMFSDGSGQIRVEIDDDVFPRHRIGPDTAVELYGEVEKDFMQSVEIDVDRMLIVDGQAAPVEGVTTTP
ncbi:MAG: NirD/YgiW/YdeI family stress tolerance protein [Gammaproteobacteria bacterium]